MSVGHTSDLIYQIKRVIGQNVLVKTAICVEFSTNIAVISFLKQDIGWTKRVGKNRVNY